VPTSPRAKRHQQRMRARRGAAQALPADAPGNRFNPAHVVDQQPGVGLGAAPGVDRLPNLAKGGWGRRGRRGGWGGVGGRALQQQRRRAVGMEPACPFRRAIPPPPLRSFSLLSHLVSAVNNQLHPLGVIIVRQHGLEGCAEARHAGALGIS
jgi:hypothetical protein